MQRWATSHALNESGQPDPHVFQLGADPAAPQQRATSEHDISLAELGDVVAPPRPAPVTPQQSAAPQVPVAPAPLSTASVLKQLKARLRVVESEIKARKSLESERDQIKRLIAAANNERTSLRAIRAAG